MEYIKLIDIYGNFFNFMIEKNKRIKTYFGGLSTIFTIIFSIFISFLLGKDFYYRINPTYLSQIKINQTFPKWPLKNTDKITFAFRLEDFEGKAVDLDNLMFIKVYYYYWSHLGDEYFNITDIQKLTPKNCSGLIKDQDFNKTISPENWLCIDFSNLKDKYLEGNFNNRENIGQILIQLDSCSYDENYEKISFGDKIAKENSICGNFESYKKIFDNKNLYFNTMIPKIYIQPDDFDNPIKYDNYFYFRKIDYLLSGEDYIFFNKITFADDKGWIFPTENKEEDLISFKEIRQNFKTINLDQSKDKKNIQFYELNFMISRLEEFSKRKFMKIQDVFAISGGFISFFRIIFMVLNFYFCEVEKYKILLNYCFNNFYKDDGKILRDNKLDKRLLDFREGLKDNKYNKSKKETNNEGRKIIKQDSELNVIRLNQIKSRINRFKTVDSKKRINFINKPNDFESLNIINDIYIDENKPAQFHSKKNNGEIEMQQPFDQFENQAICNDNIDLKKIAIKNENEFEGNSSRKFFKHLNCNRNFSQISIQEKKITNFNQECDIVKSFKNFKKLKSNSNFSDITLINNIFMKCFTGKKYDKIYKIYDRSLEKLYTKIDILNYLKILKYFKVMKTLILKDDQKHYLKYYSGENFFMKKKKSQIEEKEKYHKNDNNMIKYYNYILGCNINRCDLVDQFILSDFSANMLGNYINNEFKDD